MKSVITLIVVLIATLIDTKAQSIPNAGFEYWSNPNGYNVPDGWGNLNDKTSSTGVFTCLKGAPGNPGNAYLKLITKNIPGMGIVPGVAVSGKLDTISFAPVSGFPYTQRPTALTGKWQYMGNTANDVGYIKVILTKWNTSMNMRDTIGIAINYLTGMVMSWSNFNIPITYNSTSNPDSCIIVLSASGPNPEANS